MEFTGRIMKVLEPRTGTSERTGNGWKTQGFVFEYFEHPTDRYSDKVYLETFDENVMAQLTENLTVRIGFGHHVREYTNQQGKTMHINEIRIYKFEPQTAQKPAPQPQADGGTGAAPTPPLGGQQSSGIPGGGAFGLDNQPPVNQEGGNADDLPF